MAKRGFTLIELLVVIAIIGLLATIITGSFSSSRAKARDNKRITDLKAIQLALKVYYNDNTSYPVTLLALTSPIAYIQSSQIVDPKDNNTRYFYTSYNLVSQANLSCNFAKPIKYHLGAALESTDATNPLLTQDEDYTFNTVLYNPCSGSSANFSAKGYNAGFTQACGGTTENGADTCYDVTNNI